LAQVARPTQDINSHKAGMSRCSGFHLHRPRVALLRRTLCILLTVSLLFRASGHECKQQAKVMGLDTQAGDHFGGSVSMSGDTVVSLAANEDGAGFDAGAAYVFHREGISWRQQAKLVGNDTAARHYFGRAVSISDNSVVIGSRTYEGSAYVFIREETTWGPLWSEHAKLEAGDKRGGDEFGRSVGISGDLIVVGAPNGNVAIGNYAGAAYIFRRSRFCDGFLDVLCTKWNQEAKVWGSDTIAGQYFGDAIGISGDTIVIGTSTSASGAVYVFTRSASLTWTQQAKLYRSGAFGGDDFGASLCIYQNTLVVGAPADDDLFDNAGAAYIFTRSGTAWNQSAKVVASDKAEDHRFGTSVSISDSILAVVAQGVRDQTGNYAGSVYVFAKSEFWPNWNQQIRVSGTDTTFGDRFGASVSVSGNYMASGAPRLSRGGWNTAGAAYFLKCVTTTTSTPLPYSGMTTRQYSDPQLGSLRTKAITNSAGTRSWMAGLLIVLSNLAALQHI